MKTKLLTEILGDVESLLSENNSDVVELTGLSEADANSLRNALNKYDVRKAAVVSGENPLISYTLHISNK